MLLYALIFSCSIRIEFFVGCKQEGLLSTKEAEISFDEIYLRNSMHSTNHELIKFLCEEANFMFVFNLHLATSSSKKFSLILIG